MGFLEKITGIGKKREEVELPETQKVEITAETATIENVRAKIDLLLTQLESLRIQQQALNERIIQIEKMIQELYRMAKS